MVRSGGSWDGRVEEGMWRRTIKTIVLQNPYGSQLLQNYPKIYTYIKYFNVVTLYQWVNPSSRQHRLLNKNTKAMYGLSPLSF